MHREFESLLICPACRTRLSQSGTEYVCTAGGCDQHYPVVGGRPILVNDSLGTFDASAYAGQSNGSSAERVGWRRRLRSFVPRISANLPARKNFEEFRRLLLSENPSPLVVVLGGAEVGAGMHDILFDKRLRFLESDIVIGPRTEIVFDASYIPLETGSVDGVVIQAVLEYIPDPARAVAEIYRVLKPNGIIYSEVPFIQDVHGGRYDFTRLTHLGHLRLFRNFTELRSGACAGPATALAWVLQQFFLSFVRSPRQRDITKVGTGVLFFWLKYLDHFLANTPGGLDGATGTYLLARKSETALSDRQLIAGYRGAVPTTKVL